MIQVLTNVAPFLLTIAIVKIFQQFKIVEKKHKDGIIALGWNIVFPALMIIIFQETSISVADLKFSLMAIISWILLGLIGLITAKLLKLNRKQEGTLIIGFLSLSIGILIYPLVELSYSAEIFSSVVIYDLLGHFFLLMTLTYAIAVKYGASKTTNIQENIRKILFSPIIISLIIGIFLSITNVKIPILNNTLEYISAAFGFLIAAILALTLSLPKKDDLTIISVASVLKLIAGLLIGAILVYLFGLKGDLATAIIISTAAPVSLTTIIFAETEKLDSKLMAQFTVMSLLISLIALPIVMAVL